MKYWLTRSHNWRSRWFQALSLALPVVALFSIAHFLGADWPKDTGWHIIALIALARTMQPAPPEVKRNASRPTATR